MLPYIPAEIDAYRALLYAIINEIKNLKLCFALRPSGDNDRDRTAVCNLVKVLTPVGLYDSGSELRRDAAAE